MGVSPTVAFGERFRDVHMEIDRRMHASARAAGQRFTGLFDGSMRYVFLRGLEHAGAHEGTIWLVDPMEEALVPYFNSGPRAEEFVGHFRQPLRSGMISMVVATELPICENEVHRSEQQDRTLDRKLGLQTCAMIAVPFYFAGELRGVLSGVQLRSIEAEEPEPPGFSSGSLEHFQQTASVLGRLIEHRLLTECLGLETWG